MVRPILYFIFNLVIGFPLFGQESTNYKGVVTYVELGGSAESWSANIEYYFAQFKDINFTFRGGFGIMPYRLFDADSESQSFISIPLGIHAFNRLHSNSHLEAGLDVAYLRNEFKKLVVVPSFGYRFQKPSRGTFFKLLYTPQIPVKEFRDGNTLEEERDRLKHWFGISVGYFFSKKH